MLYKALKFYKDHISIVIVTAVVCTFLEATFVAFFSWMLYNNNINNFFSEGDI